jgi:transcriptional regulator with XRE-family HTH domain
VARIIDSKEQNIIGENVKRLRLERGMSQKQLSEKLETLAVYVCRGSISRVEGRTRTVSDIETLGLAQALDVPIEQLFP